MGKSSNRGIKNLLKMVPTWPGGQPLTYDFSVMTEKGVTTSSD